MKRTRTNSPPSSMAEKDVSTLPCRAWLALSEVDRRVEDSAACAVGRDWLMREVSAMRAAEGEGGVEGVWDWSAMV